MHLVALLHNNNEILVFKEEENEEIQTYNLATGKLIQNINFYKDGESGGEILHPLFWKTLNLLIIIYYKNKF